MITGFAKLFSAFGKAEVLHVVDPVFGIALGHLMLVAGLIEIGAGGICLVVHRTKVSLGLIAWLATNFLLYRVSLWCLNWNRPCSCLGNLTDAIHLSPQRADSIMKIVLAYLLIGSAVGLLVGKYIGSQTHQKQNSI